MTLLLEAVSEARELRDVAEREFRRALIRAHDSGHSLRTIAGAAGLHFTTIRWHLSQTRGDSDDT